jgi:hypothetical protein
LICSKSQETITWKKATAETRVLAFQVIKQIRIKIMLNGKPIEEISTFKYQGWKINLLWENDTFSQIFAALRIFKKHFTQAH